MFKVLLLVGSGGFLGSISRFLLSKYLTQPDSASFPTGTFVVNIVGCLIIGILMGLSVKSALSSEMNFFLAVGFCGGFTTFSTYSLQAFTLLEKGQVGMSLIYALGSVIAGLLCVWLGYWMIHSLLVN
ncbi:MAG: fluoride efflux transporter CrcB [Balneolaceae bacterium]|nr:fluoride efflux transporter CrcB [Balneolaceae bacterium]